MYGEPKQELLVPVGEDQAPHVELTREVVRRFNAQFGFEVDKDLFHSDNRDHLRDLKTIDSLPAAFARRCRCWRRDPRAKSVDF